MLTCDLDMSGFHKAAARSIEKLQFGVRDATREAAEAGAADAKLRGRFKNSGKAKGLREGIVSQFLESSENDALWEFVSTAKYSNIIEKGRRGVVPVRAKVLRFVIEGRVIFSMKSKAVAADPFMAPAGRFAEYILRERLEQTVMGLQGLWG